jgi:hypothetical protein
MDSTEASAEKAHSFFCPDYRIADGLQLHADFSP